MAQDDELRRRRARPAHGGERREAGRDGIEDLDAQAGERGRALGEARGRDDVRRPVDELARDVRPARDQLGARRDLARARRSAPQTTKRSTAGRGSVALPATRAVGAEDRALDDRPHLAVQGERQRLVERPGDRAAAAMRAHRPGRRGPQVLRLGLVERDDGDPLRAQLAADVHDRHRIRVRRRAHQPPLEARVELPHEQTARGEGEDVGLHLGGLGGGQLDVHRARAAIDVCGSRATPDFYHRARQVERARSNSRLCRRRRLPAVELPLPDVRGRPHRSRRTSPDAVVARDPRGGRPVVPRQRLAGPPPAARGARRRGRERRPRRARGRGPADGRGDRPRGGPPAAARVLDGDPGVRERRRSAGP